MSRGLASSTVLPAPSVHRSAALPPAPRKPRRLRGRGLSKRRGDIGEGCGSGGRRAPASPQPRQRINALAAWPGFFVQMYEALFPALDDRQRAALERPPVAGRVGGCERYAVLAHAQLLTR